MSVSERLKILVDLEGSLAKFSKKTGIKTSSLSSVLVKDSGIRSNTIQTISKAYPNLNVHWLVTGEGEMWLKDNQGLSKEDKIKQEIDQLMAENSKLKKEVLQLLKDKELNQEQIKKLWDLIEEYRGKG